MRGEIWPETDARTHARMQEGRYEEALGEKKIGGKVMAASDERTKNFIALWSEMITMKEES